MRILPDPRDRLADLAAARGESLAELSRMLRRRNGYLACYVREGYPTELTDADRGLLSRHFGVAETELGGTDPQWARWQEHANRTSEHKLGIAA